MPRFVHARASRCSRNGVGTHIAFQNRSVNEDLRWLQSHGAKLKDVRLEIYNDPSPASVAVTVVFLITYDAASPLEVETAPTGQSTQK